MSALYYFLAGAITATSIGVATFFLRFWRSSGDSLFLFFACSFFVLAMERVVLVTLSTHTEYTPFVYLLRFFASCLILAGIAHKNSAGAK